MVAFDAPLLKALGPKTTKPLSDKLGLETLGDLLRHFPRRYEKRGELTDFGQLIVGQEVTVQARVKSAKGHQIRPKLHKTDVVVVDEAGNELLLVFFNSPWRSKQLPPGTSAFFAGGGRMFKNKTQLINS